MEYSTTLQPQSNSILQLQSADTQPQPTDSVVELVDGGIALN